MPNARVGENYAQSIIVDPADAKPVLVQLTLPPELGLRFDSACAQLSGMPTTAGQFELNLQYTLPDSTETLEGTVTLFINFDPRSLWKDLPSDSNDHYWRPDTCAQLIQGTDFSIVAASKRGRSHAHVGSFRDDDFSILRIADNDWYCAVVADGAGSAKYARRGAHIVCEEVAQRLQQSLNGIEGQAVEQAAADYDVARKLARQEPGADTNADSSNATARLQESYQSLHHKLYQTVGYAAYHAVKAMHDEIAAQPDLAATYKDFSTTALIAACRRFSFGCLCVAYWVGDGAIGIYRKPGYIQLLGEVDSGEFSGQTRFLDQNEVTQEAILRRTRFALVDDFTALILMTDGVSDPKFETEAKLGQAAGWDDLWCELEQAVGLPSSRKGIEQRLLSWLDFWSTGNHDDRTLAIIY